MNEARSLGRVALGVASALALAASAFAAAGPGSGTLVTPKNTPSFEPVPQEVLIQRFRQAPELGDTKVVMILDRAEIARLQAETGRRDVLLLGPIGHRTALRDDGLFPDALASDGEFTGLAFTPDDEILRRAAHDQAFAGASFDRAVFDGRRLVGTAPTKTFDLDGFFRGEPVNLEPLDPLPDEPFPDDPDPTGPVSPPPPPGVSTFQDRVLMITNPGVVGDPSRTLDPCNTTITSSALPAWSFGRLMTDIANPSLTGINASLFVEDWLDHWLTNQTVNSFTVPARTQMQAILNEWHAVSAGSTLDLRKAPLRLIAIVNRTDLRQTTSGGGGYGGSSGTNFLNAGEGRFVFAVVDRTGGGCAETPFTVILEYGVPLNTCTTVRQWAQDWTALSSLVPGTATYNAQLQALTDVFAAAGANPSKPNRSAINQVRTNENHLQFNPWELREFRLLDPTPSLLSQTTVAETPDFSFNNTNAINSFLASAVGGSSVPLIHPTLGVPFLGGASANPSPNTFWNGSPSLGGSTARHEFSLNACSGCHAGETNTFFVHVNPAPNGALSFVPFLSGFLTGITVTDPVDSTITRSFDDLTRRQNDLSTVTGLICSTITPIPEPCLLDCGPRIDPLDPDMAFAAPSPLEISFDEFLTAPVRQVH